MRGAAESRRPCDEGEERQVFQGGRRPSGAPRLLRRGLSPDLWEPGHCRGQRESGQGTRWRHGVPTLPQGAWLGAGNMHSEGSRSGDWTGEGTQGLPRPLEMPWGCGHQRSREKGRADLKDAGPKGRQLKSLSTSRLLLPSPAGGSRGPWALGRGEHPSLSLPQ